MIENRKQNGYRIVMLMIITILVTILLTTVVIYNVGFKSVTTKNIYSTDSEISVTLANFKTIIDKYYLGEVDDEKLLESAIKGYINGLEDPYSEYFNKEEMQDFKEETFGKYTGIGIYMVKDIERNAIRILTPIKDTPAYEANILPGDIITKVDGESYTADTMNEASNKIKGEAGTKVVLEILREEEILTIEVERKDIKLNHVESKKLSNNIGYLKVSTFDSGCSEEFEEKFEELKKSNIQSLIIDIRNNGGGIVDEALNIAELITNKDETLLITVDKNNKEEITKSKKDRKIDMEIVLLINENSASASEILAGILKDHNKAKLVGVKSYGKGVIQELLNLSDGSGLKITTNEYYTPNRNKINEIGIEPDEIIKLPEELEKLLEIEESKDNQLQKAIEILKK